MKYTDLGFKIEDILEGKQVTLPDGFRLKEPMTDQQIFEECWLVFNDRKRYDPDTTFDTESDLDPLRLQYMVGLGLAYALKDGIPSNSEFHKLDIKDRQPFYDRTNTVFNWIMENIDPVMAVTLGRVMISILNLPVSTKHIPAFMNYTTKYKSYIMDFNDHVSQEFKDSHLQRIRGA